MSELSNSALRRLDLTLLLVFLSLLKHRKARDAAQELGLTQSAISQALRRLRDIFGDHLFLRRPHGMEPTATALALEAPVSAAVEALRGALGSAQSFEPRLAEGTIKIAALDAEQASVVPRLAMLLRKEAPLLNLSVLPYGHAQARDALKSGRVELAIGVQFDASNDIGRQHLFDEGYLVVGRPDILPEGQEIDLDTYCDHAHILTSPAGDMKGVVDSSLASIGRHRRVILGFPSFFPALAAVNATGAILTLPTRVATEFVGNFNLISVRPPIELRSFSVEVFWHKRNETEPQSIWLRNHLCRLVG